MLIEFMKRLQDHTKVFECIKVVYWKLLKMRLKTRHKHFYCAISKTGYHVLQIRLMYNNNNKENPYLFKPESGFYFLSLS